MSDWGKRLFAPKPTATRTSTLVAGLSLWFLASGIIAEIPGSSYLAEPPIDFDLVLRTLATGLYKPNRVLPIAIVEIDEETHRHWNSPVTTPREALARMLSIVTAASPLAVVVDIDLSGDATSKLDADQARFMDYLRRYDREAPLVFPKRLEPGPNRIRTMVASPFDEVFERNPKLAWAHVDFTSDAKGSMRHWSEWVHVCKGSAHGTQGDWLPAVTMRIAQMVPTLPEGLHRPSPPAGRSCAAPIEVAQRRLLIGPRLTGASRHVSPLDASVVSASLLLDPSAARDDVALFGRRVVLIGATHSGAGDYWLTPSGVLPGVELLANKVRYAALKTTTDTVGYRLMGLLFFLVFVTAAWWYRSLVAFIAATIAAAVIVAVVVSVWDYVPVFDALESAILLLIIYLVAGAVLELVDDFRGKSDLPLRKRLCSVFLRERPTSKSPR